jgi:hypothetical protein
MHFLHWLNAHLEELYRTQRDFLSSVHSLHQLNAHLAEFYRTPQRFCLRLSSLYISLPPEVFNNLTGLPRVDFNFCAHLECLYLAPQSSEMHPLCTAIRTCNVLSHPPGVKPQRPLKLEAKKTQGVPEHGL